MGRAFFAARRSSRADDYGAFAIFPPKGPLAIRSAQRASLMVDGNATRN